MGLFSKLFRKKKVNSAVEENDTTTTVDEEYDHREICDFLNIYKKYQEFINKFDYISRKDRDMFFNDIKEQVEYLDKLDKSGLLKGLCVTSNYKDIRDKLTELQNISIPVDIHNENFIKESKIRYKDYLDNVLKECDPNINLDDDQRTCILSDEDYSLVIAGAGAGKTTTVAAKIKYLVDIKHINPKEILVVSFTNKAVGELRERVNEQLNIDCPITTFHSTGIAIIKKDSPESKINPVTEGFLYDSVRDYLKGAITKNRDLLNKLILLFGSYFEAPFEEGDLEDFFTYNIKSDFSTLKSNVGDYNKTIIDVRTKKYQTILDERVKSHQEVQIANFLYMNGIDYKYEPIYPFYMPGSDKFYTPDFIITQGDKQYYIEHFGISEEGINNRFSKDDIAKYKKAVNDKVLLHRHHNTKLICTWSKYRDGRPLLDHLKEELIKAGFVFNTKTSIEIFEKLQLSEENKYIAPLTKLITTFISNYKVNGYDEKHFAIMENQTKSVRTRLFLEISEGAYLFYEERLHMGNQVDFSDMINESARLLNEKKELGEKLSFKYIIVDEYQDISKQRFDLTKVLSDVCDAKIIAVGDDWQSIYAFSGSDISLFTDFEHKMGYAKRLKIVKTYRNPQEVIDIAGGFVQENDSQIKKELISPKHIDKPVIICVYSDDYQSAKDKGFKNIEEAKAETVERILGKIVDYNKKENKPANSSILLIGRYGFDMMRLGCTSRFNYNEVTGEVTSNKYPYLKLSFLTAHSSKGLGFDNVVIINALDAMYGFPAQLQMDPVLKLVIRDDKSIDYAEERRLFYVAMTRTKNRVFIAAPETRPSPFILELKEKYSNVTVEGLLNPRNRFNNQKMCPICGYPLQLRFNENYGLKLYMCTNEPEICEFMTNDIHGGKVSICKCDKCKDGILIIKRSIKNDTYFLGCSNYKTINCKNQMSFQEYFIRHNNKSTNVDYDKKVEGVKSEEYQEIKKATFKPIEKNVIKPIEQERYIAFYKELLSYRKSLNVDKLKPDSYIIKEETLYDIYQKMPLTLDEMSDINGVKYGKLEKYGDGLLDIIKKYLDLKSTKRPEIPRQRDSLESVGKKWSAEEDKKLIEEFNSGMTIAKIAREHKRTYTGIKARLKKLELIE